MFKRISFVKFIETNQIDSCQDKAIIHWDYSKVELSHSFLDAFEEVHKKRQLFFYLFVLQNFLLVNNFQIAFIWEYSYFYFFSKKRTLCCIQLIWTSYFLMRSILVHLPFLNRTFWKGLVKTFFLLTFWKTTLNHYNQLRHL